MYVVACKSPFWKSTYYITEYTGYWSGFKKERSLKRAYRYTTREEAEEAAIRYKGGTGKWVNAVVEICCEKK